MNVYAVMRPFWSVRVVGLPTASYAIVLVVVPLYPATPSDFIEVATPASLNPYDVG